MTWDDLPDHCLAGPGAWQGEPWEGDVVGEGRAQDLRVPGAGKLPKKDRPAPPDPR